MVIGDWLGRLDYQLLKGSLSAPVSEVVYDSRKAGPETVFVCLKGSARDSHEFIPRRTRPGAGCSWWRRRFPFQRTRRSSW